MYTVKIEKLDNMGRGIAFLNGKIVFVENTLPDEEVEIEITKENKKIIEARVNKYIKKSKDRIESVCPYYNECGGCDLLHLSYDKQLLYKNNKVKEIMSKYAGIDSNKVKDIVGSPIQFNYRNKVTLKVKEKLGYYKKKSYKIVQIDNCLLVNNKLNDVIKKLNEFDDFNNINEIVIRSINEEETSLTIYLQQEQEMQKFTEFMKKSVDSIYFVYDKKIIKAIGKSNIIGKLNDKIYQMSPLAFFQVNTEATINLYNKVKTYVEKLNSPTLLDLYCGTGSIGIYVGDLVKSLVGVEIIPSAISDAKINANLNKIKDYKFIVGDTKTILKNNKYNVDLVIVDPPRSGLDASVVNDLFKISSKHLIYVSCDPITLARDLKLLSEHYVVKEITPFDLFPNTYHVENVVKLEIK